ncbi:MAG: FAD-dependent oxidoreductase [Deltaproteobacteria bacterium]|nr:FAD-dependent oxidoreductase [Deltaproteobacteria bacterium]
MAVKKRSDLGVIYEFKTWRDITPMNTSAGTMLHNKTGSWRTIKPVFENKTPACQNSCPAGNDIEGWIKLLQQGEYEKAYWHLKREEPFPSVLGRVCFRFCEEACNRIPFDDCVGISALERFIGDRDASLVPHPDLPEYNGKSMAVVGSGPAGMSAAYFGRLLGFRVAIFEKLQVMGGVLRVGIPEYRLPRDIIAAEFEGLAAMGIELRPGTAIGKDISLEELTGRYDYIFLATGAHGSRKLDIDGEDESRRIMSGLEMLRKVSLGEDVACGKKVAVIGGGNTAIDVARTALRMGSAVTVIYRRSEDEMPANPEEVLEAREEGARFRFLAAPERIELNDDGSIKKLICCEMELAPADESGRIRPAKKDGALFDVETDSILTSIGEVPILDYLKGIAGNEKDVVAVDGTLMVNTGGNGKIFAGGDIIDIQRTVVNAVASGKKAAIAIDCDYRSADFGDVLKEISIGNGSALSFSRYMNWNPETPQNIHMVVDSEKIVYDYFEKAPRVMQKTGDAETRKNSFNAYRETFTEDEAQQEASRCMHCGRCIECDNCLIFCPDMSVLPEGDGQFGYEFDYDYCKGCGICFTECPRHAITMVSEEEGDK